MKFYYGRLKTKMLFGFLCLDVICFSFNIFVFILTVEFHHGKASGYSSYRSHLILVTYFK